MVDNAQLALKLTLDELDVEPRVSTVDERKTVQKAVYLGQVAGVDLGYRYNWYIMGPYSPSLTRDYFALSESIAAKDDLSDAYELQQAVKERLAQVKPLTKPPATVPLDRADWLELLASAHYLVSARRMSWSDATAYLQRKKPHVAPYADNAREALKTRGWVPAGL